MTLPAEVFGPASGAALVALHGFLGRGRDWATLASRLPKLRVLAPDLPGHGAATGLPDTAFSMEKAAASVLATMDAHELEKSALLGYSMGGRLALYLALTAPTRFTHLILESASPGLRTSAERDARRHLDARRAVEIAHDLPAFLDKWYAMPLFAATPTTVRQQLVQARAANDASGLARSLTFMGTGAQPDLWPALPRLRVPTLALTGEHDAKFAAIARDMAARSDCIAAQIVPDAGHTLHLDAPEAFAHAVMGFLDS